MTAPLWLTHEVYARAMMLTRYIRAFVTVQSRDIDRVLQNLQSLDDRVGQIFVVTPDQWYSLRHQVGSVSLGHRYDRSLAAVESASAGGRVSSGLRRSPHTTDVESTLASLLVQLKMHADRVIHYTDQLRRGYALVIIEGTHDEVYDAARFLLQEKVQDWEIYAGCHDVSETNDIPDAIAPLR